MIRYTEDAEEVAAMLGRIGGADATLADLREAAGRWHAWMWGGGVFVVLDHGDTWEVHTYVHKTARGVHAVKAAAEAIRRERAWGRVLVGRTPVENRPARRFAALCGGRSLGVEDGEEVRVWAN